MASNKILLVDDDAFLLKVLKRQLAKLGFNEVVACTRPSDALAMLETDTRRFDVILCDLQMPDMDGIEFLRNVARIGYRGGLLVMSGESQRILQTAESLAKGHALHVLGTLQKPVSTERLGSILASTHHGRRAPNRQSQPSYTPRVLRSAIDDDQLVNHYQPKVEMKSGDVVGVESLVRWQHPTDGLVFPDRFIPIAEEHDLIDPLTQRVLRNALSDARAWRRAGWPLSIAVNVSMQNLVSLDFPDIVADAAKRMGIPTTSIVLEVTESQLMSNPLASLDILTRLRLKQVMLSIDDFGTGYSSLSQLRDIPFNELKVDRSFVHGAYQDPAASAIIDASFDMAKALGMTTVAEGVEDQVDWDWLLEKGGCDFVQGYFIAKPMLAKDFITWLEARPAPRRKRIANRK